MNNEGYIKFNCKWIQDKPPDESLIVEMNLWRNKLYRLGLIGVYDDGIGFGNISIRISENIFIITGTRTGAKEILSKYDYTTLMDYNFAKNEVTCRGPVKASSESMTHAAVYEANPAINAVIHVHSHYLWKKLLNNVPTTDKTAEYGTPGMAYEILRLFREADFSENKIIIMGGHKDGILAFGSSLDEAGEKLLLL